MTPFQVTLGTPAAQLVLAISCCCSAVLFFKKCSDLGNKLSLCDFAYLTCSKQDELLLMEVLPVPQMKIYLS